MEPRSRRPLLIGNTSEDQAAVRVTSACAATYSAHVTSGSPPLRSDLGCRSHRIEMAVASIRSAPRPTRRLESARVIHGRSEDQRSDGADAGHQIYALTQYRFATREQQSDLVTLKALHVDPAIPASSQDLRDTASIIAIRLVAHRSQRCTDLRRPFRRLRTTAQNRLYGLLWRTFAPLTVIINHTVLH